MVHIHVVVLAVLCVSTCLPCVLCAHTQHTATQLEHLSLLSMFAAVRILSQFPGAAGGGTGGALPSAGAFLTGPAVSQGDPARLSCIGRKGTDAAAVCLPRWSVRAGWGGAGWSGEGGVER